MAADSRDIVTYAASLVSEPARIDPILDTMRLITAKLHPGERLTADQEQALMQTYMSVEKFLLEQEPARQFTKESLRAQIAQSLQLTADSPTFWSRLP